MNTLDFHLEAMKVIANAPTAHVPALDRAMAQAQAQIAQDRLIGIIERLVAPETKPVNTGIPGVAEKDLAAIIEALGVGETAEVPERATHPSPFAGDLDLGPDEPILSPEEAEADQQLREKVKRDVEAAHAAIAEGRK